MPRVRSPQPQTARCRFVDGQTRCRRVATVGNGLCRQHALLLELELEEGSVFDRIFGAVDRVLSQKGDEIARTINQTISNWGFPNVPPNVMIDEARRIAAQRAHAQRARAQARAGQQPPRAQPRQAPRRAPPPPPPDPTIKAREILGFEPTEPLTVDKVKDRKKALAAVYHPDRAGGSTRQMQRVNEAADLLLARLR